MQDMQALGQPPSDLMADGAAGSDFFSGLRNSNPQQQLPTDQELDEMFANLPAFTERSDGRSAMVWRQVILVFFVIFESDQDLDSL